MCGISVLLDRAQRPDLTARLDRMHAPIRHRGPDGEGHLFVDGAFGFRRRAEVEAGGVPRLGLAFRRLRILDLSDAAAQPMLSPDGQRALVFNGEIYNFRELRAELEARGRVFRSTGDTEVVLAAFEAWGEAAFARFEGMWALVLVDLPRRRLVASRDRFGIKPLHWAAEGERLFLASEVKQILPARTESPRAHPRLVGLFVRGRRTPCGEDTFFEGVRAVPPATWFEVPLDGGLVEAPRFVPYWSLAASCCPDPDRPGLSYPQALDAFRTRLDDTVALHDVADVELGSLLSGGLDSSTLTVLLARRLKAQGRPCPTYSFGFADAAPALRELPYAERVASGLGLPNHQTSFDATWMVENAPRVLAAVEEPALALPVLAQYRTFQLCRERGTTVVLDGQGADEILAGYPYHQRLLLLDQARHGQARSFLDELTAIARRRGVSRSQVLAEYFGGPIAHRLHPPPRVANPDYGRDGDRDLALEAERNGGRDPSLVNRRLYEDVRWGNVKIVLGFGDRSSMAHSLEARVPFFDHRLVELAFSLPAVYKVGDGQRKRLLQDVARSLLPPEITERPERVGFALPEADLMQAGWPRMREVVWDEGLLDSPCLDEAKTRRFLDDYEAGRHADHRGAWRLFALATWKQEFAVRIT